MKYGLYLHYEEGENPFKEVREVEGFLLLPGTTPIAVWGSIKFKGEEILEVIPIPKETQPSVEELDKILKTVIKRLKERLEFMKIVEGGQNAVS